MIASSHQVVAMDAGANQDTVDTLSFVCGAKVTAVEIVQSYPKPPLQVIKANLTTAIDIAISASSKGRVSLAVWTKADCALVAASCEQNSLKVLQIFDTGNNKEFQVALEQLHSGDWDVLVYTSKLGAGYDVQVPVYLAAAVVDIRYANSQHWLQAIGRLRNADNLLFCYTNIIEAKEQEITLTKSLATRCYLANFKVAEVLVGDKLFDLVEIGLNAAAVEAGAEAVKGDNLKVTIDAIPYVADEYNQTGCLGFLASEKRVMHGWLDNKRVATKADTFWYHRPALTGLKFKTDDGGTVTVVRDYSNLNETTADDIATKLGITLAAAKSIIDKLMDKDEASDNCLVPVQYVKLRAAIDRISTNGKLTEDDHKMFGSKQPGVVLSRYGLSLDRVSNRFRGVSLTAYAEALFFAKDNSRLLDAYLNPTTANDTFEYIEPKEHLDAKISYMKSVWTVAKTAEIRDIETY
jgi:hypothetical protein